MTADDMFNPLDLLHPHEPELDSAQQGWLADRVQQGDRVLDLGCGGGRTLVPLAGRGVICTGVDHDSRGLEWCRATMEQEGVSAELIEADFQQWLSSTEASWDLICCLGNTFCQIWDVTQAVSLLSLVRARLAPGGSFVIDDVAGDLWPEVAAGHWQEGLDPESGTQLVWADDDSVSWVEALCALLKKNQVVECLGRSVQQLQGVEVRAHGSFTND